MKSNWFYNNYNRNHNYLKIEILIKKYKNNQFLIKKKILIVFIYLKKIFKIYNKNHYVNNNNKI